MILNSKDLCVINSDEFLRPQPFSKNVEVNRSAALDWFHNAGIHLIEKRAREPFRGSTTTLFALRQVRLSRGFWEKEKSDQASILWHEAVHVRQKVRAARWPSARYRLRAEVPAYRETVRIFMAHLGYSPNASLTVRARSRMDELAENIVASLRARYLVGVLHHAAMSPKIAAALTCDFPVNDVH